MSATHLSVLTLVSISLLRLDSDFLVSYRGMLVWGSSAKVSIGILSDKQKYKRNPTVPLNNATCGLVRVSGQILLVTQGI